MNTSVRSVIKVFATVALAATVVAGIAITFGGVIDRWTEGSVALPNGDGTPNGLTTLEPLEDSVRGFPGRPGANPAGRYSWRIGSDNGWMHNPEPDNYGISIRFTTTETATRPDAGPAMIGGYAGTVHSFVKPNGHPVHRFIIDFAGEVVTIDVEFDERPLAAQQSVAAAILGSIRREPMRFTDEYRLTFTLPDGWDSS
jgi:hypothetical protein